jgi:hypothetical protein
LKLSSSQPLIVPNGGYVTSCIANVAAKHFATTLSSQNQPQAFTIHIEFLRRTEVGPATFVVRDIKKGRQTSTVQVTLRQHGREEVLGFLTHSNLEKEDGVTFPTGWKLEPAPLAAICSKLESGTDENWVEQTNMPFTHFRKATQRMKFFFPRNGQPLKSMCDQWVCFSDGTKFTTESLGFVADMFPQVVESYREEDDPYAVAKDKSKSKKAVAGRFWYPTVVLNLDVKKALPKEGVKWLFCRTRSKQIQRGRLDIEIVIMDESGEIVALSNHVALVLSAARNIAERRRDNGDSKI